MDPLNAKTFGENQPHYNVKCQPQNKASQMWNPFKVSQTSKIDDQTGYPCYEHGVLIIGKDNKLLVKWINVVFIVSTAKIHLLPSPFLQNIIKLPNFFGPTQC